MRAATVLVLLAVAGCGDAPAAPAPAAEVPAEFRPACGRPGAEVRLVARSGTVRQADCDLTGVTLVIEGGGALVPPPGEGVGSSAGLTVRRAANGDVSYEVRG